MSPIIATFLLQGADATPPQPAMPANMHHWLIVSIAVVAVTLLLGVWFMLGARPKDKRHSRDHRSHGSAPETKVDARDGHRSHRRRRHRQGHSDDHLPRNPTLAETGGLPPLRDERRGVRP